MRVGPIYDVISCPSGSGKKTRNYDDVALRLRLSFCCVYIWPKASWSVVKLVCPTDRQPDDTRHGPPRATSMLLPPSLHGSAPMHGLAWALEAPDGSNIAQPVRSPPLSTGTCLRELGEQQTSLAARLSSPLAYLAVRPTDCTDHTLRYQLSY